MTDESVRVPAGGRGPAFVLGWIGLAFAAMFALATGQPDGYRATVRPRPPGEIVPGHPGPIVSFLASYPELGRPTESARVPEEGGPERWRVVTSRGRVLWFELSEGVVVDAREEDSDGRQTSIMDGPPLDP